MDLLDRAKEKVKESKKEIAPKKKAETTQLKEKKVPKLNSTVENIPEEKRPKNKKSMDPLQIDAQRIDEKISGIINERLLNLVKLGLKHELTLENMIQYFKEIERAKLYELRRYFSDSPGSEIEKMLKFLYTTGELKKDKNNWYSLKSI